MNYLRIVDLEARMKMRFGVWKLCLEGHPKEELH